MKIIHDLLPCGYCLTFYTKILDVNGMWLCIDCIKQALELMEGEEDNSASAV